LATLKFVCFDSKEKLKISLLIQDKMANYEDFSSWKIKTNDNIEFVCNEKLCKMSNFIYRSIVLMYREEVRKQQVSSQNSTTAATDDTNVAGQTSGHKKNPLVEKIYAPILLTEIDSEIFRKVLDFVDHYKIKSFQDQQLELMNRENALKRHEVYVPELNAWEERFFRSLSEDQLMGMVTAADVLEIKDLAQILVELPATAELLLKVGDYMFDVDKHYHLIPLGAHWNKEEGNVQMDTDEMYCIWMNF
jgi:hypothetical protein